MNVPLKSSEHYVNFNLLQSTSSELPPIPSGIYYGQHENLESINRGIYDRNISDVPLRPNMDFRSAPTRNTVYPVMDQRPHDTGNYVKYSTETTFAPMTAQGPLSGFNVNQETQLRNQHFALQHGADQRYYVPSSTSDLYKVSVPTSSKIPYEQPFPTLFAQSSFVTESAPFSDKIGMDMFHNCTKTQLRNM